jgi:hypothetical protein
MSHVFFHMIYGLWSMIYGLWFRATQTVQWWHPLMATRATGAVM